MMETAAPGLHDAILLGAGIASVYLIVAVLQLAQMKRQKAPKPSLREPSLRPQNDGNKREAKAGLSDETTFALYLRRTTVEADLLRLQNELHSLRESLATTREEIQSLKAQTPPPIPSAPAQLYNEAMGLARRGMSAASIALRCGISLGEAELVTALTLSPQDIKSRADDMKSADKKTNEQQPVYGFRAAA